MHVGWPNQEPRAWPDYEYHYDSQQSRLARRPPQKKELKARWTNAEIKCALERSGKMAEEVRAAHIFALEGLLLPAEG